MTSDVCSISSSFNGQACARTCIMYSYCRTRHVCIYHAPSLLFERWRLHSSGELQLAGTVKSGGRTGQ